MSDIYNSHSLFLPKYWHLTFIEWTIAPTTYNYDKVGIEYDWIEYIYISRIFYKPNNYLSGAHWNIQLSLEWCLISKHILRGCICGIGWFKCLTSESKLCYSRHLSERRWPSVGCLVRRGFSVRVRFYQDEKLIF